MDARRIIMTTTIILALAFIIIPKAPIISVGQGSSGELSGNVLHVYSHDTTSSISPYRTLSLTLSSGDNYTIQQDVFATYGGGSGGVALLEVTVTENGNTQWYGFWWYGGNTIYISTPQGTTTVVVDMSAVNRFKIEVLPDNVYFYINGAKVYTYSTAGITNINSVEIGAYNANSKYDLYVDNVNEYLNNTLTKQENFDDGTNNFYTGTYTYGGGDSGTEIIVASAVPVPEAPILVIGSIIVVASTLLLWRTLKLKGRIE